MNLLFLGFNIAPFAFSVSYYSFQWTIFERQKLCFFRIFFLFFLVCYFKKNIYLILILFLFLFCNVLRFNKLFLIFQLFCERIGIFNEFFVNDSLVVHCILERKSINFFCFFLWELFRRFVVLRSAWKKRKKVKCSVLDFKYRFDMFGYNYCYNASF